jgi:hypothetical protein
LRSKSKSFNFAWADSEGVEEGAQLGRIQRTIAAEQPRKDYFLQKKFAREHRHLRSTRAQRAVARKRVVERERCWAVAVFLCVWFIRISSAWKGSKSFGTTLKKVFVVQRRWREFVIHRKTKRYFEPVDWFVVAFCGVNCQTARFTAGVRHYCGKVVRIQRLWRAKAQVYHARAALMTLRFRTVELMAVRHVLNRTSVHGVPVPATVKKQLARELMVVPLEELEAVVNTKLRRAYLILHRKQTNWDETFVPHAIEQLRVQVGCKRDEARRRVDDQLDRGLFSALLRSLPDQEAALGCLPQRPRFELKMIRFDTDAAWAVIAAVGSRAAKALSLHINSNLRKV